MRILGAPLAATAMTTAANDSKITTPSRGASRKAKSAREQGITRSVSARDGQPAPRAGSMVDDTGLEPVTPGM